MVMDTSKNHVASQVLAGFTGHGRGYLLKNMTKMNYSYFQMIGIEWNYHDYISYQPFDNAKSSFYEKNINRKTTCM